MPRLAQAQGAFNVVSGVWPLVSMQTFEAVYVPRGRISRMYVQDAVCELGWLAGWAWVSWRRGSVRD